MNRLARLCIAGAALVAGTAPAAAVELTISNWSPPDHPLTIDLLGNWTKQITQASNGRITFNILPKPVTNPPAHWDAVKNGLVDITYIYGGLYPERLSPTYYAYMPFPGTSDAEVLGVAQWHIWERNFKDSKLFEGTKILGIFSNTPPILNMAGTEVTEYKQLEGKKIRIAGGIILEIAKQMNFTVISKPVTEVYELLSNRIIDGLVFQTSGFPTFKITPFIKYSTEFPGGLIAENFFFLMNQATWNKLSKEDQEIIMKFSGENVARLAGRGWNRYDVAGKEEMLKAGIKFVTAGPTLMAKIKEIGDQVEGNWIERMKAAGYDGRKLIDDNRAEVKVVAKEMGKN